MQQKKIKSLIIQINKKLENKRIKWRIGGSSSLMIHGVDVQPSDIELITTKRGAYKIGRCFKEYVIQSIEYKNTEKCSCYFGTLKIDEILVEIQGDLRLKHEDEKRTEKMLDPIIKVNYNGVQVPVKPLELLLKYYEQSELEKDKEKVLKIKEILMKKKYN